jgi:DNA-binding MarR family transcriptional regulator
MSSPPSPELPSSHDVPLIALVHRLNRALQEDLVRWAHSRGHTDTTAAHNSVFATLDLQGRRTSDMAAQSGITRQSMGEVVRDMAALGLVEMRPDPTDRRAKLVAWTDRGLAQAREGYAHIRDVEQRFSEEFGEREYAQVKDVLARLVPLLEGMHAQRDTP